MKPEEIKIGGVYDVRVKVMKKIPVNSLGNLEIGAYTVDRTTQLPMEHEMSWFLTEESAAFVEITAENDRKNSEPAPKYDPCLLYLEGDKVRYVKRNGRFCPGASSFERHLSLTGTVIRDEQRNYSVLVCFEECSEVCRIDPAYLELLSPVEEPYSIDPANTNVMFKNGKKFAVFEDDDEALAMCARLNAELRKELK